MSQALNAVYDELLMRHIRSPQGYGDVSKTGLVTHIHNPFCGDQLSLSDGDEIHFECECCGISMGASSLMSVMLRGASPDLKKERIQQALSVLSGASPSKTWVASVPEGDQEEAWAGWQLLSEIALHLPGRRTCASLGWQALEAHLKGESEVIAVEVRA